MSDNISNPLKKITDKAINTIFSFNFFAASSAGLGLYFMYRRFIKTPDFVLKKEDIIVTTGLQFINFRLNEKTNLPEDKTILIQIIKSGAPPQEIVLTSTVPEAKVGYEDEPEITYKYRYRLNNESKWSEMEKIKIDNFVRHLNGLQFTSEVLNEINKSLLQKLKNYEKRLKILVMGCISYGKSSFINSLVSAYEEKVQTPVITSNTEKSATQKVKKYDWFGNFEIYDCPGIEANFDESIFEELILGKIFPNITIGIFDRSPGCHPSAVNQDSVEPFDAIILTVPLLYKKTSNRLEKLHSFVKIATQKQIPIILVFTKVNEACQNNIKSNKDILTNSSINAACKFNLENNMTAFNNSKVILIDNVTSPQDAPCPYRDWLALRVLESITLCMHP